MKSSKQSDLCFSGPSYEQNATNKNLKIELAFVSIDNELKQLGESQDPKQVKRSVPDIRSQLFEVYNLAVHGLDSKEFCGKNEEC
jgi:hypothetical protein